MNIDKGFVIVQKNEKGVQILKISLKAARVNAGFTQDDVVKKLGISKTTIGNWERGKVKPSNITLIALANIYRISVDDIFLPCEFTES